MISKKASKSFKTQKEWGTPQHDRVRQTTLKTVMNSHSSELSAGQKLVKSRDKHEPGPTDE